MKKSQITKKAENIIVDKKNVGSELVKRIQTQEDMSNAILQSSHQFYLLLQSLLKDQFNFDDKDLKRLNKEVTHAVEGLAYFEDNGLHPLSGRALDDLINVTVRHYEQLKANRAGLELPTNPKAFKLLYGKKK